MTINRRTPNGVSIHAPMKGATRLAQRSAAATTSFNPRPHEGGDPYLRLNAALASSFNPRPHEGGDVM